MFRPAIDATITIAPPAALPHVGRDRLGDQKRALQVHRKIPVPGLFIEVVEPPGHGAAAGVIHQDVDGAELGDDLLRHRRDVIRAGHIGQGLDGAPARLPDRPDHLLHRGRIAAVHRDCRPFARRA